MRTEIIISFKEPARLESHGSLLSDKHFNSRLSGETLASFGFARHRPRVDAPPVPGGPTLLITRLGRRRLRSELGVLFTNEQPEWRPDVQYFAGAWVPGGVRNGA